MKEISAHKQIGQGPILGWFSLKTVPWATMLTQISHENFARIYFPSKQTDLKNSVSYPHPKKPLLLSFPKLGLRESLPMANSRKQTAIVVIDMHVFLSLSLSLSLSLFLVSYNPLCFQGKYLSRKIFPGK